MNQWAERCMTEDSTAHITARSRGGICCKTPLSGRGPCSASRTLSTVTETSRLRERAAKGIRGHYSPRANIGNTTMFELTALAWHSCVDSADRSRMCSPSELCNQSVHRLLGPGMVTELPVWKLMVR